MSSMKNLAGILALAAMGESMMASSVGDLRGTAAPNGNYKRSHKLNVKRKRLRRITKKSKQANRK